MGLRVLETGGDQYTVLISKIVFPIFQELCFDEPHRREYCFRSREMSDSPKLRLGSSPGPRRQLCAADRGTDNPFTMMSKETLEWVKASRDLSLTTFRALAKV